MTEQEKSLKLAELMGWDVGNDSQTGRLVVTIRHGMSGWFLEPYAGDTTGGLAQFAAILLKFPEVMKRIYWYDDAIQHCVDTIPPTQTNILDEVLAMHGVDI